MNSQLKPHHPATRQLATSRRNSAPKARKSPLIVEFFDEDDACQREMDEFERRMQAKSQRQLAQFHQTFGPLCDLSISYDLWGESPIRHADGDLMPLCCFSPGTVVFCPAHEAPQPTATTVGPQAEAQGVLCAVCKHIYHVDMTNILPNPREMNISL
ncbi:hypothetical protein PAQ31011_02417 [Pandoraea aquatica]|uniref:Uncharacterized protein n=1 Tax=Pandoraea aquatica TaxID=2508290 RepID=A0A5E4V3R1_9BURK|nr:hypothetical protein [Pandoraea aquatica]VVE06413.1 hypothetical protein PAQ31011_02417 [Pandoraea aquatica]